MSPVQSARTLLLLLLTVPVRVAGAEPIVVRNTAQPLWDKSHRIEFVENLRIGGDEDDEEVFGRIVFIAADSRGRIIVADHSQNVIRRYDSKGNLLGTIGRSGEGPGEYHQVRAVATDPKDNIYVASQGRVSTFDAAGVYIREYRDETYGSVRGIRALADGGIILAEGDYRTNTTIQKFVDGKHAARFCDGHKFPDDIAHHLMGFVGGAIDIGPDGMIYYTQIVPYEIRKFTPAGELVMRVFRDNDFVKPPLVEKFGSDGASIQYGSGSYHIFVLPDGRFINAVQGVDFVVYDLFDKEGRLLLSERPKRPFYAQWLDWAGNAYAGDHEAAAVVRAKMTIQ